MKIATPKPGAYLSITNSPGTPVPAITPEMAKEFLDVLSAVIYGRLHHQGLTRSVCTGELLPSNQLRIDVCLANDGMGLRWGLSGGDESRNYDHPECGIEVLAADFAQAMATLERHLDNALLDQTKGDPIAGRLTASERLARPQFDDQAAMLVFGTERAFLPWFPWEPGDPFALGGSVAREAMALVQATVEGRVTMLQAFGGTPLFLVHSPRQEKCKLRSKRRRGRK